MKLFMKILYIIPKFTTGGAEITVLNYVRYFVAQGHKVTVASVVGGGELVNQFARAGAEVIITPQKSLWQVFSCWQNLYRWCRENQPDIVHTQVFSADCTGFILVKLGVVKHWFSHQQNLEKFAPKFRQFIWRKILRSAEKIITVSRVVNDYCLNIWKLPAEKLIIIKNGVNLNNYQNFPLDIFVNKKIILATIGRLAKQKGQSLLLLALAKLTQFFYLLKFFGNGSLKNELSNLAKKLNLSEQIKFKGVVVLSEELTDVDLVVQPSLWEGLSLGVMEAMAAGRLVVASQAAGEELIRDGVTGLVFKNNDYQDLARVLHYAFTHREKVKQIAVRGREQALREFGLEKNIKKVEVLYENVK